MINHVRLMYLNGASAGTGQQSNGRNTVENWADDDIGLGCVLRYGCKKTVVFECRVFYCVEVERKYQNYVCGMRDVGREKVHCS